MKIFLISFLTFFIAVSFGFISFNQSGQWNQSTQFNYPYINSVFSSQSANDSYTQNNFIGSLPQFKIAIPDSTLKDSTKIKDSTSVKDSTGNKDSIGIKDTTSKKDTSTFIQRLSRADSIIFKAKQDSIRRIDSLSKDSTARVKYLRYTRDDFPTLSFRRKKPSSFFIMPTEYQNSRTAELDSSGTKVIIKETVAGGVVKPVLEIPLDRYIDLQMQANNRNLWEMKGYEYILKSDKKDLSQFLSDITNIDIPLPSTPLLSIFGTPKINLQIRGQVDIHGAWRNETTTGITTSALGNTRNEPDFKQQVQINLSGTIGDKLNLNADWNTERQFQYENQLKIKYTGYEDEIIQSIEAGNVSLQTSPLIGGSEALFGIKAHFKMGPFSLTALASQKKSEVKEVAVSGGSQSKQFEKHAYEYSTNHYFVDEIYADTSAAFNLFKNYYAYSTPNITANAIFHTIKDIQVWKTTTGLYNPNERKANAFLYLPARTGLTYADSLRDINKKNSIPGQTLINNRFALLSPGIDYEIHPETGFITFRTQIQDQDAIAVAYRIEGAQPTASDDVYYGEFTSDAVGDSTTRMVLKLVKPPNLQPQFKDAWKLQLRNIYPIEGRKIKEEGFVFDIKYIVAGSEPQDNIGGEKLIRVFGLDKTDKAKTGGPDGAFDYVGGLTIFPETGEIVFPVLQPFGENFPKQLPASMSYDSVYTTTVTFAKQDNEHDKFLLKGEYIADVSSSFNIGFSVVENSVKVLLDGSPLSEGTDYVVDYNLGQIVIRNDRALVPGANLKISYEQNDLFTLASKTMLGFRGLYEFNRETSLGFSFLNLNQQTLSDKVRIGEEPSNNSIFGLDFKTNINLPFITKALDKLISTSAPSNLSIQGEWAYMSPDPNTKKSTIASDDGRSIAYIDDFEGAKRTIPLVEAYGSWRDISVPDKNDFLKGLTEEKQMDYKGKTNWYNIIPSDVNIKDIYGDQKKAPPDGQQITTLGLIFDPAKKGYYNYSPSLGDPTKMWGGIMKPLSTTANNLVEENIEFIEFWFKVISAPSEGAKLYIDLGQISEDVIPNLDLDTEDKNHNDLVDEGEDVGMDGLTDAEEQLLVNSQAGDPSGDNYAFQLTDNRPISEKYSQINGTQGNAVSIDLGRVPDTEDLDGNKTCDRTNSFYRYEVPLDTTKSGNPYLEVGYGTKSWFHIKLPLKSFIKTVGSPSFSVVEVIRFWISGVKEPVHLRFAEMNLVGNQWRKILVKNQTATDDSVLTVSTVNIEDNKEYSSPPGVFREKDRTKPEYDIEKNEQSLSLVFQKLPDGEKREVVHYLPRGLDVFNYKEIKLFVHGDENDINPSSVSYYNTNDQNDYSSEVYIRFGADTLNFYEYRQPLRYNHADKMFGWDEISIKFDNITAIKQRIADSLRAQYFKFPIDGKPGHTYGIQGKPTLTQISFIIIGVLNPANKGKKDQKVSGTVWINELRVLEAEQTPGFAYSGVIGLQLADLIRVSANVSQKNPYFHTLSERFGNRQDQLNWGVSVDLDLLKLIPVNLSGSNFKISYSRTEQASNPLYQPGTDIQIDSAQTELRKALSKTSMPADSIEEKVRNLKIFSQTVGVSETWNLAGVRFKIPTRAWYIEDIFNNISLSFNYNKTFSRNPTTQSSIAWGWNANANYSVNFSRELYFQPADIPIIGYLFDIFSDYRNMKIYFAPQSFSTSFSLSRKRSFLQTRSNPDKPDIQRDFTSTRNAALSWAISEGGFLNITTSYNLDVQSSLAYLLLENGIERQEGDIWKEIFGGIFFGRDYGYRQTFDIKLNPKLPSIMAIDRNISISASYGSGYQWQNNFSQESLGRSAGYSSKINAGLNIRLKAMFAPYFEETPEEKTPVQVQPGARPGGSGGGRRSGRGADRPAIQQQQIPDQAQLAGKDTTIAVRDSLAVTDSLAATDSLELTEEDTIPRTSIFKTSLQYLKLGIKWLLLDYDQINIDFSQTSTYTAGGLLGVGTGFNNFWGAVQDWDKGPSRSFMLGLSNNPGPRAPGGNIQDSYAHRNDIKMRTSRPLWEGAQLDINWSVGWGINKTITMRTTADSIVYLPPTSTGTLDRSFLSLPKFLIFDSGIEKVFENYDRKSINPSESLSKAFTKGFESISLLSKIPFLSNVLNYLPRPNWSFTWSGLEKLPFMDFARSIQLSHTYNSDYSEGWRINPDGLQEVQTQKVEYGFNPLIGLSMNFNELFGGQFQSNIRFNSRTGYSLGVTTRNITEDFSRDINISATYSKSGFELPLFGISLKNDLEVSFSYTMSKTSSVIYEMDKEKLEPIPQQGKTSTTIEPKIRYVMSSRVTLSIFYKRTQVEPEGASRIPPTTTNEAGVDVRIAIQ